MPRKKISVDILVSDQVADGDILAALRNCLIGNHIKPPFGQSGYFDAVHERLGIELNDVRKLCGYVENGSDTTVSIGQDDATREWQAKVGKKAYHAGSFEDALIEAIKDNPDEP